jgi:hypothetical protein
MTAEGGVGLTAAGKQWEAFRQRVFKMVSVGVVDDPINQSYDVISTAMLLINLVDGENETKETSDAFLADKSYLCPVYFDDGSVAKKFNVKQVPITFFINAEGVAKSYIHDVINQSAMDQCLQTILPAESET